MKVYSNIQLELPYKLPIELPSIQTDFTGADLIEIAREVSGEQIQNLYTKVKRNGEFIVDKKRTMAEQLISDDEIFVMYCPDKEEFQEHLPPHHPRSASNAPPLSSPSPSPSNQSYYPPAAYNPVYTDNSANIGGGGYGGGDEGYYDPKQEGERGYGAPIENLDSTYHPAEPQTTALPFHRIYLAEIFHIVSICCCLMSILLWFFEIIPAVLVFFLFAEITKKKNPVTYALLVIDIVVTVFVLCIYLAIIITLAVFTFGLALILLPFCIPYVVVILGCLAAFGIDVCVNIAKK